MYYRNSLYNTNSLTYDSIDKLEKLFDINLKCEYIEDVKLEYEVSEYEVGESTGVYLKINVPLEHADCVLQIENFQDDYFKDYIGFDEIPISPKSLQIITERGYVPQNLIFVSLLEKDFNIRISGGSTQNLISLPRYIFKVDGKETVEVVIACMFPAKLDFEGIEFRKF